MKRSAALATASCLLVVAVAGTHAAQADSLADTPAPVLQSAREAAGGTQSWPLRISKAVVSTTSRYKEEPPETTTDEIRLESIGQGLIRARRRGAASEASSHEAISVYGLIEVASATTQGRHSNRRTVTELSVSAPLPTLGSGSTLAFTSRVHVLDDGVPADLLYRTRRCSASVGPTIGEMR
jgi:hypothetical protein